MGTRAVVKRLTGMFRRQSIGVWLAQAVLVLTGNLALAASLRVLPSRFSLPVRLTGQGKSVRLEYLAGPLEWDQYLQRVGPNLVLRTDTSQPAATESASRP
jgi:hypothetical protein